MVECQATLWIEGRPTKCRQKPGSRDHQYCRDCWDVLSEEFDLDEFPPKDSKGRETRYCIGEKSAFALSHGQWEECARTSTGILVPVERLHPNWARFDLRTEGTFHVYVLQFLEGDFYVGHTGKTVVERVEEHQRGLTRATRGRTLKGDRAVYEQEVSSRTLAQQLEKSVTILLENLGYRVTSR